MTRKMSALCLLFVASACDPTNPLDGGQSGEEGIVCGPVSSVDLADDEASSLGFGRSEVAAVSEGSHAGSLSYDGGGSAGLTVDVTLGDARFLDMEWLDDGSGELATPTTEMGCADLVEVDASILFSSDDGAFDEMWDASLRSAEAGFVSFTQDIDLDALTGTYTYTPTDDYESLQVWVDGAFDSTGSHGALSAIGTQTEGSGDDGTVSGTNLQLATW